MAISRTELDGSQIQKAKCGESNYFWYFILLCKRRQKHFCVSIHAELDMVAKDGDLVCKNVNWKE